MYDDIVRDAFERIASLGLPTGYPDAPLKNKGLSDWLEVEWQPNRDLQPSLADLGAIRRGFFTVMICTRKRCGILRLSSIAQSIADLFPRLDPLGSACVVAKTPVVLAPTFDKERAIWQIPVSIEYTA